MGFIGMRIFQTVPTIVVLPVYILLPKMDLQEFAENVIIAVSPLNVMIGWIINALNVIQPNLGNKIQHQAVALSTATV